MLQIDFSTIPDFNYLIDSLNKPSNLIRGIAAYRKSKFYQQFALSIDPYDKPWRKLSPATIKSKPPGKPILINRGSIPDSYSISITADGFIERVTSPVARYHQRGNPRLPQRKIIPDDMPADMQRKILDLAVIDIDRDFRRKL